MVTAVLMFRSFVISFKYNSSSLINSIILLLVLFASNSPNIFNFWSESNFYHKIKNGWRYLLYCFVCYFSTFSCFAIISVEFLIFFCPLRNSYLIHTFSHTRSVFKYSLVGSTTVNLILEILSFYDLTRVYTQ